jgi:hypothetical protein
MRRLPAAAVLAALFAGPAAADAFKVGDLGAMPTRLACMETAAKVLEAYVAEHGGASTSGEAEEPQGWTYYGWGLRPGLTDAVILCPVVGNQVNAFYTIHSAGDVGAEAADVTAGRIRALWQALR